MWETLLKRILNDGYIRWYKDFKVSGDYYKSLIEGGMAESEKWAI